MPYPIRSPRSAGFTGFAPQSAPAASPSVAPDAGGAQLSVADGPRPPSMQGFDAAPRALSRLETIQVKVDAAPDAWPKTAELMEQLDQARGDLSSYLRKHGGEASPGEVARLERAKERAERALQEHNATSAALRADANAWNEIYARVARLTSATQVGGKALRDLHLEMDGFDLDTFGQLDELEAEVLSVEQAWLPLEVAVAQMRERIERMAAEGMPRASIEMEFNGRHDRAKIRPALTIHWAETRVHAAPWPEHNPDLPHVADATAIACAMHGDQIMARLEEDLTLCYRDHAEPTYLPDERRKRLAELSETRLLYHRQIAENFWWSIEAGQAPEPGVASLAKLNIDPLAWLGVDVAARPEKDA